jgi:hypothetical protein
VALAMVALGRFLVLGMRPGGEVALWTYLTLPVYLVLAALLVGVVGVVWALRRPPALQRGRLTGFVAAALTIGLSTWLIPYPTSHVDGPSSVAFRVPAGEWRVRQGGAERRTNELVLIPQRCAGYDLEPLTGEAAAPRVVTAPAGGVVVAREFVQQASGLARGLWLGIEVAPDEVLFVGGLDASARLQPGDPVEAGEALGPLAGEGGSLLTPGPHLALHLQDTATLARGEGIPMRFRDYAVLTAGTGRPRVVEAGMPVGGHDADGRAVGERIRPANTD